MAVIETFSPSLPSPSSSYKPSHISTELSLDIILQEILPWLPVKSLARFKSVSKTFLIVISSTKFTLLHHHHSLSSDISQSLLILSGSCKYSTLLCFDLDFLVARTPTTTLIHWNVSYMTMYGSCNGLSLFPNLLRNSETDFIVINPWTRAYVDIPRLNKFTSYHGIGFGYDYINDDYKIVAVWERYTRTSSSPDMVINRVAWIYSLIKPDTWRKVSESPTQDDLVKNAAVVIDNWYLHWRYESRLRHRIVCFDVCTEEWKDDIRLPLSYENNYRVCDIGILDGRLFSTFEDEIDSTFDVWVMKEYGDLDSWFVLLRVQITVMYDLPRRSNRVVPVASRRGETEVLVSEIIESEISTTQEFYWYDIKNYEIYAAGDEFNRAYDGINISCVCKETLVNTPGACKRLAI